MGKKIKTRQVHRNIKVLDKAGTAAVHMKNAYVRTKDSAVQTQEQPYASPSEYAEEKITHAADRTANATVKQVAKQGRRGIRKVRSIQRNRREAKEISKTVKTTTDMAEAVPSATDGAYNISHTVKTASDIPKEQMKKLAQHNTRNTAYHTRRAANKTIKTAGTAEKTIKHTARSVGGGIKSTAKGTVKATGKSIKTSGHTAHIAIKTSEQAAKTAYKTAKAAQRTARISRIAARKAVNTTKAVTKATIATVKAILTSTKSLITVITAGGGIAVFIILIVVLLGGILSFMGGSGSSNTVTEVSAEVQAYEPVIRKYAVQHGISEYVELIKAVMMQESGGKGSDPMQASECAFNIQYSNTPNGITDAEYSINVGIQNLAACLNAAGAENPIDLDRIKLALQGYNFGNGYISWAKSNYGGYSLTNAFEFSAMMAERSGWSSYGDTEYVSHVLRYYPFRQLQTGGGNQAIVEIALSQIGNVGGQPYWSWYGFGSHVEWCACFVSWCADQCGYIDAGIIPKFSLCSDGVSWFRTNAGWQDRSYTPAPGDIIFFDWGSDGGVDHVGIVERAENGYVYTVEGNSGDACRQKSYQIGSSVIYGYGVPVYN